MTQLTILRYLTAISPPGEDCDSFSRGQHRQAMLKRIHRNDNKRYHTAGAVDDLKVTAVTCIADVVILFFSL